MGPFLWVNLITTALFSLTFFREIIPYYGDDLPSIHEYIPHYLCTILNIFYTITILVVLYIYTITYYYYITLLLPYPLYYITIYTFLCRSILNVQGPESWIYRWRRPWGPGHVADVKVFTMENHRKTPWENGNNIGKPMGKWENHRKTPWKMEVTTL